MNKISKITIGLLILILVLVLAIGGYTIVKLNEKIEKKSNENNELKSITQYVNKDDKDKMTEEEAKKIIDNFAKGNALYVGAGVDLNISIQYNGMPYYKVVNANELKETFSTNGFEVYIKEKEIIEKDGEYYMPELG